MLADHWRLSLLARQHVTKHRKLELTILVLHGRLRRSLLLGRHVEGRIRVLYRYAGLS